MHRLVSASSYSGHKADTRPVGTAINGAGPRAKKNSREEIAFAPRAACGAALGRKIAELEGEKLRVADQLAHENETDALKRALRKWDKQHIQAFFEFAPLSNKKPVQDKLRARLRAVVERVVLDPETASLTVHYALPAGQVVASPRGFEPLYSP